MNIAEMRKRLDALERERPDADDLVLLETKRRKASRIERDRYHRIPASQAAAIEELFARIGACIGSQVREVQWDWLIATCGHWLEGEGRTG